MPGDANRLTAPVTRQRKPGGEPMRSLRINPSAQMSLDLLVSWDLPVELGCQVGLGGWWSLPEASRAQVLGLLARLIARGVVADDDGPGAVS